MKFLKIDSVVLSVQWCIPVSHRNTIVYCADCCIERETRTSHAVISSVKVVDILAYIHEEGKSIDGEMEEK